MPQLTDHPETTQGRVMATAQYQFLCDRLLPIDLVCCATKLRDWPWARGYMAYVYPVELPTHNRVVDLACFFANQA